MIVRDSDDLSQEDVIESLMRGIMKLVGDELRGGPCRVRLDQIFSTTILSTMESTWHITATVDHLEEW